MDAIAIEGYTADELLALPDEDILAYVFRDEPLAFRVGSAEILGAFRIEGQRLVMELAHIDGGGEGVLSTLWNLATRYARQRELSEIEWLIHAVYCANPNPKLRHVMVRRGFEIRTVETIGDVYYFLQSVTI